MQGELKLGKLAFSKRATLRESREEHRGESTSQEENIQLGLLTEETWQPLGAGGQSIIEAFQGYRGDVRHAEGYQIW